RFKETPHADRKVGEIGQAGPEIVGQSPLRHDRASGKQAARPSAEGRDHGCAPALRVGRRCRRVTRHVGAGSMPCRDEAFAGKLRIGFVDGVARHGEPRGEVAARGQLLAGAQPSGEDRLAQRGIEPLADSPAPAGLERQIHSASQQKWSSRLGENWSLRQARYAPSLGRKRRGIALALQTTRVRKQTMALVKDADSVLEGKKVKVRKAGEAFDNTSLL